jgi:light-regulated signal transduction histidine kinase (bacteriophytochrome)
MPARIKSLSIETRTALLYIFFSGLWIAFSDQVVDFFVHNPTLVTQIQTVKGWLFVLVSGILIYFWLRGSLALQRQAEAEVRRLNAELEQRVTRRTQQLEAANRELEAFAYSVSHDLRAPLRGINGWSNILLEDYGEQIGSDGCSQLKRILAETRRMSLLIDNLLHLSHISRAELKHEPVDLTDLAERITDLLRQESPREGVEVTIAPRLFASGDSDLIEILLTNLLSNAWKFTGTRPDARIEVGQSGPAFFVRDNGVGFDMAFAGRLFGVFQRLHKTPEFPGTGIGLAIVQRIANRHSGRVWAESTPGQGATFYFTLQDEN